MSKQHRPSAAGFSLVELVIASSLLGLMIFAVSTLAVSGGEAQEYARRLNRSTEITQDLVDQMRLELVSCVRTFGNDAEGNANLAVLDLDGLPPPLASLRLPTVSPSETLRRDTSGAEITGNSLFFTRLAWSDRFVGGTGKEYLVDVYRWVYYYLTPEEGGPQPGSAIGLNLVRVLSEPLVDASGIDRIADPADKQEVLMHLVTGSPDAAGVSHVPCQMVWVRGGVPTNAGTLRQINSADGTLSDDPIEGRADPFVVQRSTVDADQLLTYRHHSVATNHARGAFGVARYGIVDNSNGGFPHGFEVQVVGPSSARQIMLHLVVASTNRRGQAAWGDVQVSVDARDL